MLFQDLNRPKIDGGCTGLCLRPTGGTFSDFAGIQVNIACFIGFQPSIFLFLLQVYLSYSSLV